MTISDGFKKLTLAAIGAGAMTYEKTSEILGHLVEKGEITVDQGKVINSELRHNVKESVKHQKDIVEDAVKKAKEETEAKRVMKDMTSDKTVDQAAAEAVNDAAKAAKDVIDLISKLSVEQIAVVRKTIDSLDHNGDEVKTKTAEKEEATDHEAGGLIDDTEKIKNDEEAEPGE